ncbi:MAG: hypothetical protein DRJ35_03610 [Thermoprotei archaeon]|nr:MAG: hypothetical protein DRJ35_03610 [Thermoprotei archaeon]
MNSHSAKYISSTINILPYVYCLGMTNVPTTAETVMGWRLADPLFFDKTIFEIWLFLRLVP